MTNKLVYQHESRVRDIIISNKLKCEFSDEDIKRILNGQKPWKEINNDENENKKFENNQKKSEN